MKFKDFYINSLFVETLNKRLICNFKSYLLEKKSFNDVLRDKYKIEQFEKTDPAHCVCSIGFAPSTNKWYGWSHRAIYGFTVGSTCKIGNCHFMPSNKEEFLESLKSWYKDEMYKNVEFVEKSNGVNIKYEIHPKNTDKVLKSSVFEKYPTKWGSGEWTAKTIEDAKQMAVDFARSVS